MKFLNHESYHVVPHVIGQKVPVAPKSELLNTLRGGLLRIYCASDPLGILKCRFGFSKFGIGPEIVHFE